MVTVKTLITSIIYNPERIALHVWDKISPAIPDKLFLAVKYRLIMGYWMDFNHPKTYTEKLQWLKLYDRHPSYTTMVDKLAVKKYVAQLIGEKYVIPTLGVWDRPEQIEWDILPDKFVLKTTHGGGNTGVVIVKDKKTINRSEVVNKLNKALKQDIYSRWREYPYKHVQKRIIAEQYLDDNLKDYKFYCFDGKVELLLVASNRTTTHNFDYFDMQFRHLDLTSVCGENSHNMIVKPANFETMIALAQQLSAGIPHVRVDMYNHQGEIYFGELTFYDSSGYDDLQSKEWNQRLGDWIVLPSTRKNG